MPNKLKAEQKVVDLFGEAQGFIDKHGSEHLKAQLSEQTKSILSAEVKDGRLILNLEGFIDSMFGTGSRDFARALAEEPDMPVTVNVNSPGGSFFEAISIMNRLSQRDTQAVVTGNAGSAASIVLLGADEILMGKGSSIFIHEVRALAFGPSSIMRRVADVLDNASEELSRLYADRTGMDAGDIMALMKDDTTMYAAEAISKGFADGMMKGKAASSASSEPTNMMNLSQEQARAMARLALSGIRS